MSRRIPIVGHPVRFSDWLGSWCAGLDAKAQERFASELAAMADKEFGLLVNSGVAAFFLVLRALRTMSPRQEVVLPCYTAPSLVVAIHKAGLKPVCADITFDDFNADAEDLLRRVTPRTLAVVGVHMFGIPWTAATTLRERLSREVFFIEDCAQAFGARIGGRSVGAFGDVSFYSFNRGKNLPTYEGGCVVASGARMVTLLREAFENMRAPGLLERLDRIIKCGALYLAFKPRLYGALVSLIARYKETRVPLDVPVSHYTSFQAAFGRRLWASSEGAFKKRQENAAALMQGLEGAQGITLPQWTSGVEPVLNRLPVLMEGPRQVGRVIGELDRRGIEASRLYARPLHHIFEMGYAPSDFPRAVALAERLVTLPVHPLVTARDIATMLDVIKSETEQTRSKASHFQAQK